MFKFPADFGAALASAPKFDFKALVDIQQKNLDAMIAANTKLAEGAQEILKRQAELLQLTMQESIEAMRENFSPANATKVEKHLEFFKASAEKSVASARELTELAGKSGNDAIEILRKRATDSVGEFNAVVKTAA